MNLLILRLKYSNVHLEHYQTSHCISPSFFSSTIILGHIYDFFFVFQECPKTKFSYNILTLMFCYLETKFYNFTYMY
jgi:hypothetical protein